MDDIPAVGQHTEAILSELGITASEIEVMRSQGAI
jgi:crotonobetainyl-CoA:carnitine CoA-transferase CaiB-like acyl-CoA transferase